MEYHPDRNPDNPTAVERFREVTQAYEILGNPTRRALYDELGTASQELSNVRGIGGVLVDLFGSWISRRGRVQVERLKLSFEEAALGCIKVLHHSRLDLCSGCGGNGAAPGAGVKRCQACEGKGHVTSRGTIFRLGPRVCFRCNGTGRRVGTQCRRCKGRGLHLVTHEVELSIPADTQGGALRVIKGEGHRLGPRLPYGDLHVHIEVVPHPIFTRRGNDVVCRVPISFIIAAQGGTIEVPTLEGTARLIVPAATQSGQVLRMRNKGIPYHLRPGRGDQLVRIRVEVPVELSTRAQAMLVQLKEELDEAAFPEQASFHEKMSARRSR